VICLGLQTIKDGFQHEQPDYWLNFGNPWEIQRPQIAYDIKYYGHVSVGDENGRQVFKWHPGETVSARNRPAASSFSSLTGSRIVVPGLPY
jgi:glucan phosphorylase